jgi:DNA polymerase III delta prime subunit
MILGEDTSEYFDSQYDFARNELILFKPNVYFGYSELIDLSELDKLRNQMSNSLQNIKEKYNCNIRFLLSLDYN